MIHLLSFHYVNCQRNAKRPEARRQLERTVAVYLCSRRKLGRQQGLQPGPINVPIMYSVLICCPGMLRRSW